MQKVAVTEKTESCEVLLSEIAGRTEIATEKKQMAIGKKEEIAEQNIIIAKEKVFHYFKNFDMSYPYSKNTVKSRI